ncbi:mRNA-decapping enzyme 1B [Paramormyrops kingsleyae]|uniref:5'-(N(7)-methylguanosine 5'-triphospho)-[mRNA] hydrolase n=1 Tax=Paramormyrops kingsleyae TaxID=1676925 RepID=A0A3B3R3X5_9TELE
MTASTAGTSNCFTAKSLDISLAALKRQDPYINNIVDVASQVALYTFSNKANEWEKTDVEGTLFVYTRLASPRHGFTIMNRLSMDNLTEPITKDLDFQLQDPFLLYRNARWSIYGIWFYDKEDCQRIAELMKNLTQQEQLLAQQGEGASPGSFPARDGKGVDILQMLTKARVEYDKGKPASEPKEITSSSVIHDNPNLIKPIPVKPLERHTPSHQQPPQDTDTKPKHHLLAALFGAPSRPEDLPPPTTSGLCGGRPPVARSLSYEEPGQKGGIKPAPSTPAQPCAAIQKLMATQRGPGELLQPVSESPENRLCENGGAGPTHCRPADPLQRLFPDPSASCCPHGAHAQPAPVLHCLQPPPAPAQPQTQADLAQPLFFSPGKPSQVSPHELLQRLQLVQQEQSQAAEPPRPPLAPRFQEPSTWVDRAAPAPAPPASAPPVTHKPNPLFQVISPQRIPATVAPTQLLSPMAFSQTKPSKPVTDPCPPSTSLIPSHTLTRSQLQATLLHLIQNDVAFLDTIYESYVATVTQDTAAKNF